MLNEYLAKVKLLEADLEKLNELMKIDELDNKMVEMENQFNAEGWTNIPALQEYNRLRSDKEQWVSLSSGVNDLRDLIENINKEYGTTFLISSHILEELIKVSTDIIIIKEGKVLRNISKEQMLLEKGDLPIDRYYLNVVNAN